MGYTRAIYQVTIGGLDVSSKMNPILETISVEDKDGVESDSCEIVLADPDGVVRMPSRDDPITVLLGHVGSGVGLVFTGFVDSATSTGAKGGGRTLSIKGKSARPKGKHKEPHEKHLDDKSFGDAAKEFGKLGGIEDVRVDGALAAIKRDYWSMDNESFAHWGQRMARALGATFKISGDKATFQKRNAGTSAGGQQLSTVRAVYGDNLINWSISPDQGRPQFKKTKVRWYDHKKAKWKTKEVEIGNTDAKAERTARFQAADEDQAKSHGDADKAASERHKGAGSVLIVGDAAAKPEGTLIVVGAKAGIDGAYTIESVKHAYSKGRGYTSDVSLKQPKGGGT